MLPLDINGKRQNVGRSTLAGTRAENALASSAEEVTAVMVAPSSESVASASRVAMLLLG